MIGDDDLRDCFAMFAMLGVISDGSLSAISFQNKTNVQKDMATFAYEMADAMMEARKSSSSSNEAGIVAIKRKYERK